MSPSPSNSASSSSVATSKAQPEEMTPFFPINWTLSEIRGAIPSHLFRRDARRSLFYLARDLTLAAMLWLFVTSIDVPDTFPAPLRWAAWVTYWWFQGLVFTGIWVIGHECGHGAFSSYKWLNDSIGLCLHTVLWTPYYSWKISHHRHHITHASMERDEVYVPSTKTDLGIPDGVTNYEEYFGDTPIYTFFTLILQQLFAFPAYLCFNVSGQKIYPRFTSHFNSKSVLFTPGQRRLVHVSNLGIVCMLFFLKWACDRFSATVVFKFYGIPWLLVSNWIVLITYLHHTDPLIPHYRGREWSYQRGAVATMDRPILGWQGRFFLHDVAHFHVIHHLFPKMPFYHAEEATQHLRKFLGGHYMSSRKPFMTALWDSYNNCQFVDDEGDIVFYRNKRGNTVKIPRG